MRDRAGNQSTRNLSRHLLILATIFLPQRVKLAVLGRLPGWTIGRRVHLGFSFVDADSVILGDDVSIGHFNLFVNVGTLRLGDNVVIKNFNSFHGGGHLASVGFPSSVSMGDRVQMMSHHFVDCAGSLVLGDDVTLGGRSTEIYTHQLGQHADHAGLEPSEVSIGHAAYVGARCTLVSCVIPPAAVVGAGAVVVGDHTQDDVPGRILLAGNPATVRKRYPDSPTVTDGVVGNP